MSTLVYCTAYAAAASVWDARYRRWIDAIRASALQPDQILIVDDGSASLPGWSDTRISSGLDVHDAAILGRDEFIRLHHFQQRLGRAAVLDFPGWHRSFVFGALYARAHGFDKIIHIESDAYLLSPRAQAWFRDFTDGWAALWAPEYSLPESAFQVISGSALPAFFDFARRPYDQLIGRSHENALPLTHVEKGLIGGRYGESLYDVPRQADYAAQVHAQREPGYYWWLNAADLLAEPSIDWQFGTAGNMQAPAQEGWHNAEPHLQWMSGMQSQLNLPATARAGRHTLRLAVDGHISPGLASQRLILTLNGRKLHEFCITERTVLGCEIPSGLLRHDGRDRLRFIHPDGASPHASAGHADKRILSVMLTRLTLSAHAPAPGRQGY